MVGTSRLVLLALLLAVLAVLLLWATLEDLEDLAPFLVESSFERHLGNHGEGGKEEEIRDKNKIGLDLGGVTGGGTVVEPGEPRKAHSPLRSCIRQSRSRFSR